MTDYDDAVAIPGQDPDALDAALARTDRKQPTAPAGWETGIAWDGREGVLTTGALEGEPDGALWSELIADWNLDPSTTEVVPGSVQVRGWDANVGAGEIKRLRYYRATIRARSTVVDDERADVDALCAQAARKRPRKSPVTASEGVSLVIPLSDWQIGKGEGGGTPATVERITHSIDAMTGQVANMKRAGRTPEAIYLLGMGDLVEQCSGHYAAQTFTTDLDRREQKRVARRLILRATELAATLAPRVVLAAIPGNHGENRNAAGQAYTNVTDSDDLAAIEEVSEVLAANPDRYSHVSTVLARDLTLVLGVSGVNVGMAHGHQYDRGAGHPAQKAQAWWTGQAMGRQPVADADILITGHLHHLVISETTGRTHIQCPAQDGGSCWYTSRTGQHSPAGGLMLGVGTAYGPRGWGDLTVL